MSVHIVTCDNLMQSRRHRFVSEEEIRYLKRACISLESAIIEQEYTDPKRIYSQPYPVPLQHALASTERIVSRDWSPVSSTHEEPLSETGVDIGSGAYTENKSFKEQLPTTDNRNRLPPPHCRGKPDIVRNPCVSALSAPSPVNLKQWRPEEKADSSHPFGMANLPPSKRSRTERTIGS